MRHLCQHTGERPYQCADCDAAFVSMHRLKEHSRKTHGHEFNSNDKVYKQDVGKNDVKSDARNDVVKSEPTSPKKTKKHQASNVSTTLVQSVPKLQEVCINSSATVLPTAVLTSLPTSIPLLVQAANGQVYLLSTQNVSSPTTFGGSILVPTATTGLEILTSNQTIFFPSQQQQPHHHHQQQQHHQTGFLTSPTGSFFQTSSSQLEAESLLSSALQAAVSASTIATTQSQVLLHQHQQQQQRQQQHPQSSQRSPSKPKRESLVDEIVSPDVRKFRVTVEGIRKVDNGSNLSGSLIGRLMKNKNKKKEEEDETGETKFHRKSDIIKAALAENNIS